jgi:hypothetical protein
MSEAIADLGQGCYLMVREVSMKAEFQNLVIT